MYTCINIISCIPFSKLLVIHLRPFVLSVGVRYEFEWFCEFVDFFFSFLTRTVLHLIILSQIFYIFVDASPQFQLDRFFKIPDYPPNSITDSLWRRPVLDEIGRPPPSFITLTTRNFLDGVHGNGDNDLCQAISLCCCSILVWVLCQYDNKLRVRNPCAPTRRSLGRTSSCYASQTSGITDKTQYSIQGQG